MRIRTRRIGLTERQVARLLDHIDVGLCWEWTRSITDGYGKTTIGGKTYRVHRLVWTLLVGPLDAAIVLDHLCRNRRCCNPDHLEPIDSPENTRRGRVARQVVCRRAGHPLSDKDRTPSTGRRFCRACANERKKVPA